mgnify:CR=1 FL=1
MDAVKPVEVVEALPFFQLGSEIDIVFVAEHWQISWSSDLRDRSTFLLFNPGVPLFS